MPNDPSPATAELAFTGVAELRSRFTNGSLSSSLVTETLLRRIDEIDRPGTATALRAVLAVSEQALDAAAAADRRQDAGERRGPLDGIPILIKDNVEVEGMPSCAGATSLLGRPPSGDAPLADRLRAAGAVILGTTNLSEWSDIRSDRSTGGWSAVGGLTANPWALDRSAGGSSSGSGAAVAAGLAPLAVGTETDGSIICPASLNGVAGIKPSVGVVPTTGVVPISHSQDSPGPMARSAADAALLLEVLSGCRGILERIARGVAGIRVGAIDGWRTGHPGTDALFEESVDSLREAGASIVRVAPPTPGRAEQDDKRIVLLCELKDGLDRYLPTRGPNGPQSLADVIAHEEAHADTELCWFGHELFAQAVELGGCDNDFYRAARARNLAWAIDTCLGPALADVDVLVAPTYGPAWKSDLIVGGEAGVSAVATTAAAIAGWPIATVPMGLVAQLPVGLGLIGRPGSEAELLALGAAVERPARPAWIPPRRG